MTNYTDEELSSHLRDLIAGRKLSVREVSETIGVPYRTLQNQLLGRNKMPASTFARLLSMLQLPIEFVATGRFQPNHRPLADALKATFGDLLPAVDEEMRLQPAPKESRGPDELDRHAVSVAFVFRNVYEREIADWEDDRVALTWRDHSPLGSQ